MGGLIPWVGTHREPGGRGANQIASGESQGGLADCTRDRGEGLVNNVVAAAQWEAQGGNRLVVTIKMGHTSEVPPIINNWMRRDKDREQSPINIPGAGSNPASHHLISRKENNANPIAA